MSINKKFLNVDFKGILSSDVCSNLVIEVIKYFLFERQQMTIMYNDLLRILRRKSKTVEIDRKSKADQKSMKTQLELVDQLNQIFKQIRDILATRDSVHIRKISLILGTNVLMPKDVLTVHLPIGLYEGELLEFQKCKRILFRELMVNEFTNPVKSIGLCRLHVLIEASKTPSQEFLDFGFNALVSYSNEHTRCQHLQINLTNEQCHRVNRDLSFNDEDSINDISGVDFLTDTKVINEIGRLRFISESRCDAIIETEPHSPQCCEHQTPATPTPDSAPCDVDHTEYAWYQLPCNVRGNSIISI